MFPLQAFVTLSIYMMLSQDTLLPESIGSKILEQYQVSHPQNQIDYRPFISQLHIYVEESCSSVYNASFITYLP